MKPLLYASSGLRLPVIVSVFSVKNKKQKTKLRLSEASLQPQVTQPVSGGTGVSPPVLSPHAALPLRSDAVPDGCPTFRVPFC